MAETKAELKVELKGLTTREIEEIYWETDRQFYEERPVTLERFLEDPEYLGASFGDAGCWPFWKKVLKEMYPSAFYSPYWEVLALLPIGSGKSLSATASLLYEMHRLLCLKNPQRYYSVFPARIVFTLFSAAMGLASDVNWAYIENYIDTSPWFKKRVLLPKGNMLKSDRVFHLGKNIDIVLGSRELKALGKAVFGGLLDEANFQAQPSSQAQRSYNAISRRMESRFLQEGGRIPGKLWLVSSSNYATDFLTSRIQEQAKTNLRRTFVVPEKPIWEIRQTRYSGKTFRVFVGDDKRQPKILEEGDNHLDKVYNVPVEYKDSFDRDLLTSIKDIIGRASVSNLDLIKYQPTLNLLMSIPHRFDREVIELEFADPEERLYDFVLEDYFRNPVYPSQVRFIHLDLGLTKDTFGAAACFGVDMDAFAGAYQEHVGEWEKEKRVTHRIRNYFVDWAFCIKAKRNQEIPIYKIREFLIFIKALGYPIKIVTTDNFQSRQLRQELRLAGFESEWLSVDETRDPYLYLAQMIQEKRAHLPILDKLRVELLNLKDDGKKVDHPTNGSKDIADGVAGAVWTCSKAQELSSMWRIDLSTVETPKGVVQTIKEEQRKRSLKEFGLG